MEYRDIVENETDGYEIVAEDTAMLIVRAALRSAAEFTVLEEQVIALARQDRLGSLGRPGPVDRLLGVLFGARPGNRPLADSRLEALRRAVVVARHRHHLPDAQAMELRQQGFGPDQVRTIEARAVSA